MRGMYNFICEAIDELFLRNKHYDIYGNQIEEGDVVRINYISLGNVERDGLDLIVVSHDIEVLLEEALQVFRVERM